MRHLCIYGSSDDLIEIEGDVPGADEYNGEHGAFDVAGLRIGVDYDGCWGIRVARIDEGVPVVAENLSLSIGGYSTVLDMDVPDGAYVSKVVVDAG